MTTSNELASSERQSILPCMSVVVGVVVCDVVGVVVAVVVGVVVGVVVAVVVAVDVGLVRIQSAFAGFWRAATFSVAAVSAH